MTTELDAILGGAEHVPTTRTHSHPLEGQLPLTPEMLLNEPGGNLFGLTQNVAMGWNPEEVGRDQYVIASTHGGMRAEDGTPIALGYHTGHWEVNLLVRAAAETLRAQNAIPFAMYCSDPCDGRSQGTDGMMDSLPYRNDAAMVIRRQIRSLPTRDGVMGIGTCDKGLPAMMLALAGCSDLPGIIVPGGVTLPADDAEDAGKIQTIGARYAEGVITLEYAATMGCRACGSSGGGCQFLGTAATSQVVAEGFGLSLPHSALSPSGEPIWLDMAHRSALALLRLKAERIPLSAIITPAALENAMLIHAAFGGSTNLLLHIPAIAYTAGIKPPTVEDWNRINRSTPRLVDALPNGPRFHPTVQVFMAGGVPEVMLHLRRMGLLNTDALTVTGEKLDTLLDWWEGSERRHEARRMLRENDQVNPDVVIMDADSARREGLTSTVIFPSGNLAPQGSVIKATAIDATMVDEHQVYHHIGRARVFTSERAAIQAVKGQTKPQVKPGNVIVLIGIGPKGTGMVETAQITSALKYLEWGKHVALLTDGRFSGFSTGACVGHIGPEALSGGPIGRVRDGDLIEIRLDREGLTGMIHLIGTTEHDADHPLTPEAGAVILAGREPHPGLHVHPRLPDDSRLWAALQEASGGTWAGCIYDVDKIVEVLQAGIKALAGQALVDQIQETKGYMLTRLTDHPLWRSSKQTLLRFNIDVDEHLLFLRALLKWIGLGSLAGIGAGTASAIFLTSLQWATDTRLAHPQIILFLPLIGILIGWIYMRFAGVASRGNQLVIEEVNHNRGRIPLRMAPLVLVGTVLTHLFGGSAGREGTAIQMGASLADGLRRVLRLDSADRRLMIMAGISGGFGSVFGTPIAGFVFGMEVQKVGRIRYEGVIPCLVASLVGDLVTRLWGVTHSHYPVLPLYEIHMDIMLKVILAGIAFGLTSLLFVELTHIFKQLAQRSISYPPLRLAAGGTALLALTVLVGSFDYLGLSLPLIRASLDGNGVITFAFLLKLLFTTLTLGTGFLGGEVTPLFVIGSTLGFTLGRLLGVETGLMASIGFVAVFAGASNTPLACMLMGVELFGGGGLLYIGIGCFIAYLASGHRGIYATQLISTPKIADTGTQTGESLEAFAARRRENGKPVDS